MVAVLRLVAPGIEARWARRPAQGPLHLVAPAGVAAAAARGAVYALCGRVLAGEGLAGGSWSSGTRCVSCLAVVVGITL